MTWFLKCIFYVFRIHGRVTFVHTHTQIAAEAAAATMPIAKTLTILMRFVEWVGVANNESKQKCLYMCVCMHARKGQKREQKKKTRRKQQTNKQVSEQSKAGE